MIDTTAPDLPTITATCEDAWDCACGNREYLSGFYHCSPTGRTLDPDLESDMDEWDGKLYYCPDCGLVMDQTTYDSTTQTIAVVGRIQISNDAPDI
jgi:uncharacterized Zn finger protein